MERARSEKAEITSDHFDEDALMWGQRQDLYRLLKKYTSSIPRQTIENVREDNGWVLDDEEI